MTVTRAYPLEYRRLSKVAALTSTEMRRFFCRYYDGLGTNELASIEGVSAPAITQSVQGAAAKIAMVIKTRVKFSCFSTFRRQLPTEGEKEVYDLTWRKGWSQVTAADLLGVTQQEVSRRIRSLRKKQPHLFIGPPTRTYQYAPWMDGLRIEQL